MTDDNNPDKDHPFAQMLDKVFGPGVVDIDEYVSDEARKKREQDKIIRERMERIERKGKIKSGEIKVADRVSNEVPKVADGVSNGPPKVADRVPKVTHRLTTSGHTVTDSMTPCGHTTNDPHNDEAFLKLPINMKLEKIAGSLLRKKILLYVLTAHKFQTSYEDLSILFQGSKSTIRKAISHYEKIGALKKTTFRNGLQQGLEVSVTWPKTAVEEYKKQLITVLGTDGLTPTGHTVADGVSSAGHTPNIAPLNKEINNLSIKEKFLSWKNENLQDWYPLLFSSGFKAHSLHQMVELMDKRSRDLELITFSLDHIEWELEHGGVKNREGKPVEGVAGYFFKTMTEHSGFYRQPKGYVDPREAELQRTKQKLKKIEEERIALEEKEFDLWKKSLSQEDLEKLLEKRQEETKGAFAEPQELFLKRQWREITGRPLPVED